MITVVTPFQRKENLPFLIKTYEGKVNWTVLIDDPSLKDIFPSWVTVKLYDKPRDGICKPNSLFNSFISELDVRDEVVANTQFMLLCDDDSVEDGFFNKIPDEDVVLVSMKRGEHLPMKNCNYGVGSLIAHQDNLAIGRVSGEQLIVKGRILRGYRYGLGWTGDGEMVIKVSQEHKVTYVPDAYVLFNYFEDGRYDSFRRKPLVMFVGDLYCAGNPKMGKSEWEGNLWSSLDSTGLVDLLTFHFDKYWYHYGKRGDEAFLKAMQEYKPDLVVLVVYKALGGDPITMMLSTLASIDCPIVSVWGDLEAEEQGLLAKSLQPFMWKIVGTATKAMVDRWGGIYMHVPKDPRIFNNPDKIRDIDIVFSGSYGYGREERQEAMLYLLNNKINLVHGGSEGGDHFSTEEYADRYKRAKLTLSFSRARGVNVVNARPFEAMLCGSMLLEQESLELAKLYTPFVHYVPWTDKVDLLEKVKYYLEHEDERTLIASQGQKRTEELYSAKTFWSKVLEK